MRAVQHGAPAVQTHKYPQNWRKEVGGRRETLGTCPGKQLYDRFPHCRKSAPVTTKGFPSLPEGPAHILTHGCPGCPQAGSKSPGSRTPNLYCCKKSLPWSTFPAQLSPPAGVDTGASADFMLQPQAPGAPGLGVCYLRRLFPERSK